MYVCESVHACACVCERGCSSLLACVFFFRAHERAFVCVCLDFELRLLRQQEEELERKKARKEKKKEKKVRIPKTVANVCCPEMTLAPKRNGHHCLHCAGSVRQPLCLTDLISYPGGLLFSGQAIFLHSVWVLPPWVRAYLSAVLCPSPIHAFCVLYPACAFSPCIPERAAGSCWWGLRRGGGGTRDGSHDGIRRVWGQCCKMMHNCAGHSVRFCIQGLPIVARSASYKLSLCSPTSTFGEHTESSDMQHIELDTTMIARTVCAQTTVQLGCPYCTVHCTLHMIRSRNTLIGSVLIMEEPLHRKQFV